MPFQTIEAQRLYQRVAEQIGKLIEDGEFAPGDRLPPERDLVAKLGVSRPTIREAMIALEIAGVVEVRTGAGVYVKARPSAPDFLSLSTRETGLGPLELIEARRMIEGEIAARAAVDANDTDIASLTDALDQMRAAESTLVHRRADRLFHRRIAEIADNGVIIAIVESLWDEMFSPMFERMGLLSGLFPESSTLTLEDHQRIADAITVHDPAAARQAMERHLQHVEQILLRGRAMFEGKEPE